MVPRENKTNVSLGTTHKCIVLTDQVLLLYLATQIRFLIVTCHWSKLHDALGQQQLELSTHTWSGRAPLKRRQICTPADVKQIIFIDLNVSLGFASGNIEGLGETKLTVSLGASH